MILLRTTPERIAELRAVVERIVGSAYGCSIELIRNVVYVPEKDWCDVLEFVCYALSDLTTENERLRAEVAAKDVEITKVRDEALDDAAQIVGGIAWGYDQKSAVKSEGENGPNHQIAKLLYSVEREIQAEKSKPRADTAEAALKAGHAGEVTDAMALEAMIKALELDEEYSPEEARRLIVQGKDTPHDGDCTKRPYTCVRCVYEDAITRGRAILSAALAVAPTPSDLAPGLRRAAEIADNMREDWSSDFAHNSVCEAIANAIRAEIGDAS